MTNKIRLGFVGANIRSRWASASHFPALKAHPDVELTAVCTTNPASAEEARQALGAKLAFSDYRAMAASPEIDAVAVVVRVPSHYAPARAAIEAGKHVFVEWPLGRTTAEAVELAALARAKGVVAAVGLQSRMSPALLHMKQLLAAGYVGEVLAVHVTTLRGSENGAFFERESAYTWLRDVTLGANPLTIAAGHSIDALRLVLGDFARLGGLATTQVKQWYETDTKKFVDVTSPDNIVLTGQLKNGAVVSMHVAYVPFAPPGYRMEVYGRKGTLVASAKTASNLGPAVTLQGAQDSNELQDLAIPDEFTWVPHDFPRGSPFNVGQNYALFAESIRNGLRTGRSSDRLPTFDTAVELHHIIDAIRVASDTQRILPLA